MPLVFELYELQSNNKKNAINARKGNDHRQSRCKRRKLGRHSKDKRHELDLAHMRKATIKDMQKKILTNDSHKLPIRQLVNQWATSYRR